MVHETYGVGRYVGLQLMEIGGQSGEFLALEYRDGDRVYVPVHALHLVNRYTGGAPESAPLHKLGTDQWAARAPPRRRGGARRRRRAARPACAPRGASGASRWRPASSNTRPSPMAFRSRRPPIRPRRSARCCRTCRAPRRWTAWCAATSASARPKWRCAPPSSRCSPARQVAMLVPTTLLAQQHLQSFRDRFADWPVRIEALSRFRSSAETQRRARGRCERGSDRHRHRHPPAAARPCALPQSRAW